MSTRKLIITALLVGMLILVAGAVQFIQIASTRSSTGTSVTTAGPSPTSVASR
ncbi:MAG: hypothetical protein ACYDH6_10005 [Acidimicrobiales bacterium]